MREKNEVDYTDGLYNLIFGELEGLNRTFRFSGNLIIRNQSVAEHSFWTALITGSIVRMENKLRCMKKVQNKDYDIEELNLSLAYELALIHDIDEVWSGDLKYNFKYYDGERGEQFRKALKDLIHKITEEKLEKNSFESLEIFNVISNSENTIRKDIVKIADWLQLAQYLMSETKLGSKGLRSTLYELKDKLKKKINELKDLECQSILKSIFKRFVNEINNYY